MHSALVPSSEYQKTTVVFSSAAAKAVRDSSIARHRSMATSFFIEWNPPLIYIERPVPDARIDGKISP